MVAGEKSTATRALRGMYVASDGIAARQTPAPGTLRLDHVRHFVPDIDAAAAVLEGLGLTLLTCTVHTPGADCGAGECADAAGRCVMLEDGYLEFLAPVSDAPSVPRTRLVKASHACMQEIFLGTPAAAEEHARLVRRGYAPPPLRQLEIVCGTDGDSRQACQSVVCASPAQKPEGGIHFVQHMTPGSLWRTPSLAHASSVCGLRCTFVVADSPADVAARCAQLTGLLPQPARGFIRLTMAHGEIWIGNEAACKALFGEAMPAAPALAGYGLVCRQPQALRERLLAAQCRVTEPSPGLFAARLPAALGSAWLFGHAEVFSERLSRGGR